jgi:8-oxo-dGTP diphosphatase
VEGWRRIGAYVLCRDRDERVLLTRFRWPGHPDDGTWTAPGGSMEWGESPEATARRELFEETGLSADLGPILGIYSSWYTAEESVLGTPGQHLGVVYRGHTLRGTLRDRFADGTTDRAEWFTIGEAQALPLGRLGRFLLDLAEHR